MSADTIVQITQQNSNTKEILNFVGSRMDSLAPVLKEATKTVAENVGHYGKEWVAYKAYEVFSGVLVDVFLIILAIVFAYFSFLLWKKFLEILGKEKIFKSDDAYTGACVVTLIFAVALSIASLISTISGCGGISNSLPKAIAAINHPEGLAVELLIQGIKK